MDGRRDYPNFRHLRAFCAAAELASISRAAERVHLSQPAITQAIANLEERLGTPLFERRPHGLHPTEAGLAFHARAARALELIEIGSRELARLDVRRRGAGFASFTQLLTVAQLRALSAVSRTGNFSLAARSVAISQPSLHRAARDLEQIVGVQLFLPRSHGYDLSRGAEALAHHAKLAFAELDQGFAEIAERLGRDAGRIVVGTLPLARTHLLPEALNRLAAARPGVGVRVIDGPYADLLHGLRHGDIDLIVGALREPAPIGDVEQVALFEDILAIVARAGHPLAGRKRLTPADLLAYPWVVPIEGTPTRGFFDRHVADAARGRPGGLIEASSLVLVRGLLCSSDRLTIISPHQIKVEREQGLLVPLDHVLPKSARQIGYTIRRDWRPTATQRELITQLVVSSEALAGVSPPP